MEHIETLKSSNNKVSNKLLRATTGKFYTHYSIGVHLIKALIHAISSRKMIDLELKVVDPFAGDGRLVEWLLNTWTDLENPKIHWKIELWDINPEGLEIANKKMEELERRGISLHFVIKTRDAFRSSQEYLDHFDVVLTNPPWEILKPDARELKELEFGRRNQYIDSIRKYDNYLTTHFPNAQPKNKFAGWGTNLSRVGLELSHLICKNDGFVAIIIPASFFADEQSQTLRHSIIKGNQLIDIGYFPAEAKLFNKADVNSTTFLYRKALSDDSQLCISVYNPEIKVTNSRYLKIEDEFIDAKDNVIPISLNVDAVRVLTKIREGMPSWGDLAKENGLWAGRELDETGKANWLTDKGNGPKFIKGSMIERYAITQQPSKYINKENWKPSISCEFDRIAWRDVSRNTQKRRLIATVIPKNTIAGNSLSVAYFKDGDLFLLRVLLGIMNSLCFEFQVRAHLATGHVSLSAVRKVHIPAKNQLASYLKLENEVTRMLEDDKMAEFSIEAIVAKNIYNLSENEFDIMIRTFKKITDKEREKMLFQYNEIDF